MKKDNNTKLRISERKTEFVLLILILVGGVLILVSGFDFSSDRTGKHYTDVEFYTEYLETKISELCMSIAGIEKANVFLTLDCSSEYVYGESSADYLILKNDSDEEAVMLREIYPKVRGVAVVCTGGEFPRIRETVTEILAAAMGISTSKIRVAGM